MSLTKEQTQFSRRQFLHWTAMGGGALVIAACSGAAAPAAAPTSAPEPTPEPDPTATPEPAAEAPAVEAVEGEVEVMAGDVLEYILETDEWKGGYGQVTFRIHEAKHNGESAYFIRTDASDPDFAEEVGLVYVPLLNAAAAMDNTNILYMFSDDRAPVISMIPGDENYSSLFKVMPVEAAGDGELDSEEALLAAIEAGNATIDEERNLFVNYPLVMWPGGGMTIDEELTAVLPGGQLFEPVDTENMSVKMKLHQCYPGSRYILTDTGAVPMAPMMNIVASGPTNQLKDLGGTDEIWVFANGIPGPGVMGFQPAIFDNKAGEPAWSPFWDHFTVKWVDEANARVLTTSIEIRELIESGELELFNGVPDSHPNGFVVNCPAPILAPNNFAA